MITIPTYHSPILRAHVVATRQLAHAVLVFSVQGVAGITFEYNVVIEGIATGLLPSRQVFADELTLYGHAISLFEDKLTFSHVSELPKLVEDYLTPTSTPARKGGRL